MADHGQSFELRKSTSPRTGRGKALSRHNAVSHGLTAAEVVFPGENESQFEQLLYELNCRFRPRDGHARFHVNRLAGLYWRLQRVPHFEKALLEYFGHELRVSDVELFTEVFPHRTPSTGGFENESSRTGQMLEALLGRTDILEKLARHEAHLMRQAQNTLAELLTSDQHRAPLPAPRSRPSRLAEATD